MAAVQSQPLCQPHHARVSQGERPRAPGHAQKWLEIRGRYATLFCDGEPLPSGEIFGVSTLFGRFFYATFQTLFWLWLCRADLRWGRGADTR